MENGNSVNFSEMEFFGDLTANKIYVKMWKNVTRVILNMLETL